jgi:hypothetical protein
VPVPALVLLLSVWILSGGRTTAGITPVLFVSVSSEQGAKASVDRSVEVQRRSAAAITTSGLGLVIVCASAEPQSRKAASRANEIGEDAFMTYSYTTADVG